MSKVTLDRIQERKACDAVARSLEGIASCLRSGARYPEDANPGRSEVDYACAIGPIEYAFEHTVVEAFDGQLRMDDQFGKFVGPIEAALNHRMPKTAYFRLLFPIDPSNGMNAKATGRIQTEIIAWAKIAANELVDEVARMPKRPRRSLPPTRVMAGSDISLDLQQDVLGSMGGMLMAARIAPRGYEELRISRVTHAIDRKLPKLANCRPARTVLVLENRDGALSNHWVISECVETALKDRADIPNEVWLVDAVHGGNWFCVCMHKDGMQLPYDHAEVRFREFNPAELSIA